MARQKNEIVKKSNVIIRAYWPIESVWEPRMVALLASKIHVNDKDFAVYEIPITEVIGQNYSGRDLIQLEAAVKNVMKHPFTIQISPVERAIYNLFDKCVINSEAGILKLGFHPDLKPHFLQLKANFTQYSLAEFLGLQSIYSQRLYEILKSYMGQNYAELALDELYKALDFPKAMQANFSYFRRKVLEQADKEIVQGKLSLQYRWDPIKSGHGGKVSVIRFTFRPSEKQVEGNDEELIRARFAKLSSSCYFSLMKRKVECNPKPNKSSKCKYCVEYGNMSFKLKNKASAL
jgi:plasmid replication initiation protein